MTDKLIQITRTTVDGNPPVADQLAEGELSVELGAPKRLWVGAAGGVGPPIQLAGEGVNDVVTLGATAPPTPTLGSLWFDDTAPTGSALIWTVTGWVPLTALELDADDVPTLSSDDDILRLRNEAGTSGINFVSSAADAKTLIQGLDDAGAPRAQEQLMWVPGTASGYWCYKADSPSNELAVVGASSRRFKHKEESKALPAVLWDVEPKYFEWHPDSPVHPGEKSYGLIAEDIEAAGFEEALRRDADGRVFGIRELPLIGALWAEVRALRAEVAALKAATSEDEPRP